MLTKMQLAKSLAMGTSRPTNSVALKIVFKMTAAPDATALGVWKFLRNLSDSSLNIHIAALIYPDYRLIDLPQPIS